MNDPNEKIRDAMQPSDRVLLPAWKRGRSVALAAAFTGLTILPFTGALSQEAAKPASPSAGGPTASGSGASTGDAAAAPRKEDSGKSESGMNWNAMLQTLMTSPGQRELMGNLKELIRQGDMAGAKQLLSTAVDLGTIAIVVTDHVEDPALLAALDKLGVEGQRPPAAPQMSAKDPSDGKAMESNLAELKNALEQERNRADAASQELRSAQGQLAALPEKDAKAAEFRQAAAREKERADAAQSKLSSLQERIASMEAGAAGAAELKAALNQEKERAAATARELETVKAQVASLKPVGSQAAELKAALDQEKAKAASLQERLARLEAGAAKAAELEDALAKAREQAASASRELVSAQGQLAALTEKGARAAEVRQAAAREKERADAAQSRVASLQDRLAAVEAGAAEAAELKAALRQEKEQAAATARELESVKAQVASLQPVGSQAAELQASLDQEKERNASYDRELQAAREQLAAFRANEAKRADTARELVNVKAELALVRSAEIRAAQFKDALEREKQRADATARELSAVSAQLASIRSEAAKAVDAGRMPERKTAASGDMDDLKRMVTAAMSDYVAARGLKDPRAQEKVQWGNRSDFTPAALLFQLPLTLQPNPDNAGAGRAEDKTRKASVRVAPTAALPAKAINPPDPDSTATVGTPRGAKELAKPETPKPAPRGDREPAGKPEKVSAKNEVRSEPRRAAPAREAVGNSSNPRVLFLPPTLQPIDEEWEFE
jgi:hypothetical protein